MAMIEIIGNFDVNPEDNLFRNQELGLIREAMFLYGVFEDEHGRSYALIRAVNMKEAVVGV